SDVVKPLPLVANGLGVLEKVLRTRAVDVRALVHATLQGLAYTIAHPQDALALSRQYVPGLDDPKQAADAQAVLQATIPVGQAAGARMGYNDPATWTAMGTFMAGSKLISPGANAAKAFTNDYLS